MSTKATPLPKKKTRAPAEKFPCPVCGRFYSQRRLQNHKCIPPTFPTNDPGVEKDQDKENEPPAQDSGPVPEPPTPDPPKAIKRQRDDMVSFDPPKPIDLEALTPDVISALIRKDREAKRAAKRERWAAQLF